MLLSAVLLALAARARADEASGTWTGTLEGRGNYFWERSTRVVVPNVRIDAEAPNGTRLSAQYLVDVIASASIAQTGSDEDAVFTELRHGVGAAAGGELDLDTSQLDVSAHADYSTENDYESLIYGVDLALSLNERNTKLSLGGGAVNDTVEASNDPDFDGHLDGVNLGVGLEQVLNAYTVLTLSYQLARLDGYLGNPYRRAAFAAHAPEREAPPEGRTRHNGIAGIKFFIPASETAIHLRYRAYLDSWDIGALTPELRVYQHFGPSFVVRGRYRYYRQTRAWFAQENGLYPAGWDGPTTNDPKLIELETHTFGAKLELQLSALAGTFLDFASNAWIDVSFDRYLSTSRFGNGVVASAGGRLPF